jgi:SAM-dependent methyltransferase
MAESDRIKWDQRYAQPSQIELAPPDWIEEFDSVLPCQGHALDIAAGAGRLALWLAERGLDVLAVDISPAGLELISQAATERGLKVETLAADLEIEPLPLGPFDVITCFNYRQRDLFPQIRQRLKDGGYLLAEIATVPNLKRHPHPSRQYLAEPQELRRDCAPLEIVYYQEGWFDDRASARVVARKLVNLIAQPASPHL